MDVCEGCGLEIEGGAEACQRLFDEFRVREAAELASSYALTRVTIDVYCLQHPDRYCVSAKSLAAHLTGLAWVMGHDSWELGFAVLQRWLNGRVALVKPALPSHRGELTIGDVHAVPDPHAYNLAVVKWARSTWAAYAELHELARNWIDEAMKA